MARRTDPLSHWRARSYISAEEYAAARRFQALYDACALAGHASLDIARERVDGGRPGAVVERIIDARRELLALKPRLGEIDFGLISRVLGRGEDLAGTADEIKYLRRRVRDGLARLSQAKTR